MMKLDMDMFVKKVNEINSVYMEKSSGGVDYLYEVVAPAVLKNEDLYVRDVDFSRFTTDEYEQFYEEITRVINDNERLYLIMCNIKPQNAVREKEFF